MSVRTAAVGAHMTTDVITVRGGAPVATCAMLLAERGIRHLAVVDDKDGLIGLIDDATVFQRGAWIPGEGWVPFDLEGPQVVARDLAAPPPRVVGPSEPLIGVLQALRAGGDCVFVIDSEYRPVGIFTDHDAVVLAARELPPDHLARDAGTQPVVTVQRGEFAFEAYDALFAFDVRHAIVVEGEQVVAVLSWRDLVEHDVARRPHLRVSAVLPENGLFTVRESEPVAQAALRMAENRIGCLPVTDESGRLLRIIERGDVIGLLVDHLSRV